MKSLSLRIEERGLQAEERDQRVAIPSRASSPANSRNPQHRMKSRRSWIAPKAQTAAATKKNTAIALSPAAIPARGWPCRLDACRGALSMGPLPQCRRKGAERSAERDE